MRVIEDVRSTAEVFPNVVLTVGSFDGVHLGHQRILRRLVEHARAINGTAALMTLDPHPRQFFSPRHAPNILTGSEKKRALLAGNGVEVLYVLPFNAEVANLDREHFLHEIVLRRCRAVRLIVGHDFAFGKDAAGNHTYLEAMAPRLGFAIEQVPPLVVEGERVSSTLIREYILQGDLDHVERFLGRKYSIVGEVKRGRGMGAKLGYPTANIEPGNYAVPVHGVYIAEALLDGKRYQAAVNIGIAPTIRHEDIMVEAFLLGFNEDIVGKQLEVIFHRRLRPELKFNSLPDLIAAIGRDVEAVRAYFLQESKS